MVFELEWWSLAPMSVSLVGGLAAGVLSTVYLRRMPVAGRYQTRRLRALLVASIGLLVAGGVFGLDLALHGAPKAMPAASGPSPPPAWLTRNLPAGMVAPDFTLPDLRTDQPIRFHDLRGQRPAVLIFGSFG